MHGRRTEDAGAQSVRRPEPEPQAVTASVFLGRERHAARLKLGRLLGEGAAGKVYALPGRPGFAAKIYHDEKTRRRGEAKIDAMIAAPPRLGVVEYEGVRYPQLAWPEAKLYDARGAFAGFLMSEIDFRRSTGLVNLLQRSSRRAEGISDYYGHRLLVARNLAVLTAEMHQAGHHLIDMKPANLRFYPAVSWIAVIDTDGFSIAGKRRRIPADQISDEYVAPEGWQKAPGDLGEAQDRFALAVILFQLMNNGLHPFAGAWAEGQPSDLQGRIQAGLYCYALHPVDGTRPGAASLHESFKRSTRELFDRAFLVPHDRPSAAEWRTHLDDLLGKLAPCAAKPQEHAHFGGGCGFCAHEARLAATAFTRPQRNRERDRGIPLVPAARLLAQSAPSRAARPRALAMPARPLASRPAMRRMGAPGPAAISAVVLAGLGALSIVTASAAWRSWLSPPLTLFAAASASGSIPAETATAFMAPELDPLSWKALPPAAPPAVDWRESAPGHLLPSPPAFARLSDPKPGFDVTSLATEGATARSADKCGRHVAWIDRRLCERLDLAAVDDAVVVRYRFLLEAAQGQARRDLARDQWRWLQSRSRCALARQPDACLARSYRQRMAELFGGACRA